MKPEDSQGQCSLLSALNFKFEVDQSLFKDDGTLKNDDFSFTLSGPQSEQIFNDRDSISFVGTGDSIDEIERRLESTEISDTIPETELTSKNAENLPENVTPQGKRRRSDASGNEPGSADWEGHRNFGPAIENFGSVPKLAFEQKNNENELSGGLFQGFPPASASQLEIVELCSKLECLTAQSDMIEEVSLASLRMLDRSLNVAVRMCVWKSKQDWKTTRVVCAALRVRDRLCFWTDATTSVCAENVVMKFEKPRANVRFVRVDFQKSNMSDCTLELDLQC
eukprot:427187_1